MSNIVIRRATSDDAALLVKLSKTVHEMHLCVRSDIFKPPADADALTAFYSETLTGEDNFVFIAHEDEEAVGYIVAKIVRRPESTITKSLNGVHIDDFCVAPSHQMRGHGSALMEAVYELAREQNIRRVTLDVWAFNTQALAFYEKRGFSPFMHRLETHLAE